MTNEEIKTSTSEGLVESGPYLAERDIVRQKVIEAHSKFWGFTPEESAQSFDLMIEEENGFDPRELTRYAGTLNRYNRYNNTNWSTAEDIASLSMEEFMKKYDHKFYTTAGGFQEEIKKALQSRKGE